MEAIMLSKLSAISNRFNHILEKAGLMNYGRSVLVIFSIPQPVQTGTGIALFHAQENTTNIIKSVFTSFFLGQILLVLLTADQISGEVEQETFPLIRSKPVYDSEVILGKFSGMFGVMLLIDIPTITAVYTINLISYKAEYPEAYLGTIDEIIAAILIVLLLQSVIIAFVLVFSSIFARSLYAILASLITIFILSTFSNSLSESNNYISFNWLLDATLPEVFYHLEPIDASIPSAFTIILFIIGAIISFLSIATIVLRNKELL
jgi:ABC-type transport system involved in multi-copper enzyme maturation permease subunit